MAHDSTQTLTIENFVNYSKYVSDWFRIFLITVLSHYSANKI